MLFGILIDNLVVLDNVTNDNDTIVAVNLRRRRRRRRKQLIHCDSL